MKTTKNWKLIKALTISQPYASLIVNPPHLKRVENRTWATPHRGPLVIHAGKRSDLLETWPSNRRPEPMPFGAAIGIAELVDVMALAEIEELRATDALPAGLEWLADHGHVEGPWCWVLGEVLPLRDPVRMGGLMGLWSMPLSRLSAADAAVVEEFCGIVEGLASRIERRESRARRKPRRAEH